MKRVMLGFRAACLFCFEGSNIITPITLFSLSSHAGWGNWTGFKKGGKWHLLSQWNPCYAQSSLVTQYTKSYELSFFQLVRGLVLLGFIFVWFTIVKLWLLDFLVRFKRFFAPGNLKSPKMKPSAQKPPKDLHKSTKDPQAKLNYPKRGALNIQACSIYGLALAIQSNLRKEPNQMSLDLKVGLKKI